MVGEPELFEKADEGFEIKIDFTDQLVNLFIKGYWIWWNEFIFR